MIVRKIRGQNKIGKILLSATEYMLVKKSGVPIEFYVSQQLVFIAKKRRWKWYLNKKANHAKGTTG